MKHCVSVIIPVYNSAPWLVRVLESCLAQGEYLKEVILVEDGSLDESHNIAVALAEKFPGLVFLYRNPCKGGNNARNYGFSQSQGEFIQWLDSDDLFEPDKFRRQLEHLHAHPETGVVYSDFYEDTYDSYGNLIRRKEHRKAAYEDFTEEILKDNWSPPLNYLLRREVAQRGVAMNGWNPETRVLQDREYITTVALSGVVFGYVPGLFSIYNRWTKSSVSASPYEVRMQALYDLGYRFRQMVAEREGVPESKKRLYYSILDTQILLACSSLPHLRLRVKPAFRDIRWKEVRGSMRTRRRMLRRWLKVGG